MIGKIEGIHPPDLQILTSGYDLMMMITLVTFYQSISTASWIHPWMCKTQWDTTRAVYRWGHSMSSWGYDTCNWITERLAITYYSLELTSKYADVVISGYIPRWYRNSLHIWNVANAIHPHSKAVAYENPGIRPARQLLVLAFQRCRCRSPLREHVEESSSTESGLTFVAGGRF